MQAVKWGTISVVRAERRLLANALLDPLNQIGIMYPNLQFLYGLQAFNQL